jgi:hypothetical protein
MYVETHDRATEYNYLRLAASAWRHTLSDGIVRQSARRQLCFVYEYSVSFSQA